MDLGIEIKDYSGNCEEHGDYSTTQSFLVGQWRGGECPQCVETKQLREEGELRAKRLSDIVAHLLRASGIPARYEASTLDTYKPTTERSKGIHASLVRYVADFQTHKDTGTSIALLGEAGTGKTHLGCAIVSGVIHGGLAKAHFTTVTKMIRRVRATYNSQATESEGEVLEFLINRDLLVIDEIGVQSGSDHEHNILFEVINERYANLRPTLVLSNLGAEKIREVLGERVMDRFREGGAIITFDWGSFRGNK